MSEPTAQSPAAPWARLAATLTVGVAFLALVGILASSLAWRRALAPRDPAAEPVRFEVPAGATLRGVADRLEEAGLVRHAWALVWLGRWRGQESSLRAGEYELSPAWPTEEILGRIVRGEVKTHEVVLPEGLAAAEIATRLAQAELVDHDAFLDVVRDPGTPAAFGVEGESLEGYLFPETYRLPRGLGAREVARVLVDEFRKVWDEVAEPARARGLGQHEVVTLASIVEKETGAAHERALIASVFHNRLRRGMRLESDPTVIYGIPDFDGNLRRVHLEDASNPWNTYRNAGLPPTPIANPGRDALLAVVRPAESEFLYFVSRNDGTHDFSRTYAEHAAKVDRFQRRGRRR